MDIPRLQPESPTDLHRVACVHCQVDDDLLELAGVGAQPAKIRRELDHQVDVLADQAAQHLLDVREHVVHIEDGGLQHLAPAEREQLAGEAGGRLSGARDLPHMGAQLLIVPNLPRHHLGVAENRREQVVEIMGDAAGELTDGIHLVGVPELRLAPPQGLFCLFLLRQVAHEAGKQQRGVRDNACERKFRGELGAVSALCASSIRRPPIALSPVAMYRASSRP